MQAQSLLRAGGYEARDPVGGEVNFIDIERLLGRLAEMVGILHQDDRNYQECCQKTNVLRISLRALYSDTYALFMEVFHSMTKANELYNSLPRNFSSL